MSIHAPQQRLRLKEKAPRARHPLRDSGKTWLLALTWRFLRHLVRFLRAPLDSGSVTKFEYSRLFAYDVQAPTAQVYLSWRRSALIVAVYPILLSCVIDLVHAWRHFTRLADTPERFRAFVAGIAQLDASIGAELAVLGTDLLEPMVLLFEGFLVLTAILTVFATVAALSAVAHWRDHRRSRRRLMLAWGATLVQPLLVSVIPVRLLIEGLDYVPGSIWVGAREVTTAQIQAALDHVGIEIGVAFALLALLSVAPLVLAVFPAIMRAGFYAKKLVPESPIPGWAIAVIPPLYLISASPLFAVINQVAGSPLLLAGISASLLGPLAYTLTSRWLTRPTDHEHLGRVTLWIRSLANLGTAIGAGCLIAFVVDVPELLETVISNTSLIEFGIETVRNYLISTIVATDLLVYLLLVLRIQERHFVDGNPELRAGLDARLDGLVELEQPHREFAD